MVINKAAELLWAIPLALGTCGTPCHPAGCCPVFPLSLCLIAAVCDIKPPSLGVQEKMQLTWGIWACRGVGELAESQEVPKMGTPHLQDGETAAQERLARGCKTGSGKHPQVPWTLTEIYFSYKRHQ